jgi:hypothetical protein
MQRFKYWVLLLAGSGILIGSIRSFHDIQSANNDQSWLFYRDDGRLFASKNPFLVTSSFISVVISALGVGVCVLRKNKYTYLSETVLVFLVAALWCFTMGTLIFVSFENEQQTSLNAATTLPQLYFVSWGLTITSIINFASWLQQHVYHEDSPTATQWTLLVAIGAFVALSGIAFANQKVEDVDPVTGVVSIYPVCETAAYSCKVSLFFRLPFYVLVRVYNSFRLFILNLH